MNERSRADTTSAEDKSIGFDYQYYYFLNELLNLKTDQSVGLEVLDDVHIELANGKQLLVQLKHTVQTNAAGLPKNLTTSDGDLWKSLSNWCKLVSDKVEGRADPVDQRAFVKKTGFVLATNKSESQTNTVISSVAAFKAGSKDHAGLIADIETVRSDSSDATLQSYIDDILALDPLVSADFFEKLSFCLGHDEIIDRCKTSITEKQIDASRVDDVFRSVDSQLRAEVFASVKARKKVIIAFREFNLRFRRYFDKARSDKLVVRELPSCMPANLLHQTFIRQLLDIKDVSEDNVEYLAKFTTRLLNFQNNIEQWSQDGDITQPDIQELEDEAEVLWEAKFLAAYPSQEIHGDEAASGRAIIEDLRQKKLTLASTDLPISISNGGFYDLSDRPRIGWLRNWKDRYN